MRIYIAGKVTGEEKGKCFQKFAAVEYQLKQEGFEVVNPMRLCNTETNWHKCMKICIKAMLSCDAVFTLPDWNTSVGATMEVTVANVTGVLVARNLHDLKKIGNENI